MVEFDKNGMLIVQTINKKIKHGIDHDRLCEETPQIKRRKLTKAYEPLLELVIGYAKTHDFVSRSYIVGLYCKDYNLRGRKKNYNDYEKNQERIIRRKLGDVFSLLEKLGIVKPYNKNAVKINQEKLEAIGFDKIADYVMRKI